MVASDGFCSAVVIQVGRQTPDATYCPVPRVQQVFGAFLPVRSPVLCGGEEWALAGAKAVARAGSSIPKEDV